MSETSSTPLELVWLKHPVTIMIRIYLLDTDRKDDDFIHPPGINGITVVSEVFCQINNTKVELLEVKSCHSETCIEEKGFKNDKYEVKLACSGKTEDELGCEELYWM